MSYENFANLLRELFQFDCADLDFGIYRIMNYKRGVIEGFITQDLPRAVAEELDRGALASQSQAMKELQEVAEQIRQAFGTEALETDGSLMEAFHGTPLGQRYLSLKAKATGGRDRQALETLIFNHLFAFFSRYYQDGDFISKRRYSKREKYAIPYNGEEVYLYWANQDQYYIKTDQYFNDYTFTVRGVTVHFKLQAAEVEQNNVKGDKRFFLPRMNEIVWEEEASRLTIPFEFRPLTEQEMISYGAKNQQETIIAKVLEEIPKHLKDAPIALAAIMAERRQAAEGQSVSFLEHHLRKYTRRNTSDFFIHKNLKGFLSRELDFYLKNEVLNLDEIESAGEGLAEGWFQVMRIIKAVGSRIIEFLAQIEDFQKMLWEKKKFITEVQYCITMSNIPEEFYPAIAACEAQWDEWKDLFHIDEEQTDLFTKGMEKEERRIAFLKAHPTLVLDTKHFNREFVDRLIASFNNLEGLSDGLLIHGENFQTLTLLGDKYRNRVICTYIDPPYNTGSDGFLYKDQYQHSSWVACISDRVNAGRRLLTREGALFVSIGNEEYANLRKVIGGMWGDNSFKSAIIQRRGVKSVQAQFETIDSLNQGYEYIIMFANEPSTRFKKLLVPKNEPDIKNEEDENGEEENNEEMAVGSWNNHWRGTDRPTMRYELFGIIPEEGQWRWGEKRSIQAKLNYERMLSELNKEKPTQEEIDVWVKKEEAEIGARIDLLRLSSTGKPEHYIHPSDRKLANDLWADLKPNGSAQLKSLFGTIVFDNPKSVGLITRLCEFICTGQDFMLDYYAGSGTTAHGVIEWNRTNDMRCRFILVEMAKYFDTVLLPRIKKVIYTPEWKKGKPKRMATEEEVERSPRLVKYLRLESYEDALNNIEFDDATGQAALPFDDYLIKYMLKWETRQSETFLNVEKLSSPFSYKLRVHADGRTGEKTVDIPETFNYLMGLHVKTRRVYEDRGRCYLVYRGRIDHREVAIIWREIEGWTPADFERDRQFVIEQKLAEGAAEIFVNGDSFIPGARSLDPVFKARMFAPLEV